MGLTKVTYSMIDGAVANVLDYGATGDGVADDTVAIQAALDAGVGSVFIPAGSFKITAALLVPSNTKITGAGIGATVIKHGASQCFKNKDYLTTGNSNISISNISFDADATFNGAIQMWGVTRLIVDSVYIYNVQPDNVSVGIGLSSDNGADCSDIIITNSVFDCADYCVVIDATSAGICSKISISNCTFTTAWGSCISFAGKVQESSISNNIFNMPGDGVLGVMGLPNVGFGVKLWQGIDVDNAPENISIVGNSFTGKTGTRTNIIGVNTGNWAQQLTITGNTFKLCNSAFNNNFGGLGTLGLTFNSNVVTDCDIGCQLDTSTDVEPSYVGNQFLSCGIGLKTTLRNGIIDCNKFRDITEQGIYLVSPAEHACITGNLLKNIGKEAIYIETASAANGEITIVGNSIWDTCTSADNTYNSIELNSSAHNVSANTIFNESTTIKPIYIIGSTAGANFRLITSNFMFGARSGYREVTGANDVYANNIERGGIG